MFNSLLELYKDAPYAYKIYNIVRYNICPFFEIEKHIPSEGGILDCGCGHGLFTNFLAMKSNKRYVIGMDTNKKKIKAALSSLRGRKNVEFRSGGLEEALFIKDVKCFLLMDVLYFIPLAQKKELLMKFYKMLPNGAALVIKTVQKTPRWKYLWTLFHVTIVDNLFHRGFEGNTYFLKKEEYLDLLKEIGFTVDFKDLSKGYPYPHCLYICTKN